MRGLFQTVASFLKVVSIKKVECSPSKKQNSEDSKVFNDPIHGHIELPILCVRIMNTVEFQRLCRIKQLGATYLVYPGASHNRFEHSLGVCFLAGKVVQHLMDRQPELKITEQDKLCVQIAGLCHDLGHGPLSHLFETHFIRELDPFSQWKHEDASIGLFEHLLEKNKKLICDKAFTLTKEDINFIKELICTSRSGNSKPDRAYTGREPDKDFLYQIVSNKNNGVDVDKWDYFARDCYHLGFKNNFDHNRLIQFSRVIEVKGDKDKDGKRHICYRDKEVEDIYHMYYSRVILHRRACQHKTTNIIEIMYMKALRKANEYFRVTGKMGKKLKISECIKDMEAYAKLTDKIFDDILSSEDTKLKEARKILNQIKRRELYKRVGSAFSKLDPYGKPEVKFAKDRLRGDEQLISKEIIAMSEGKLTPEDLLIHISVFDYGYGDSNPIDNVYFYSKDNKEKAFKIPREQVSHLLPNVYSEQVVTVYSKNKDKNTEVKENFHKWCSLKDMDGSWKLEEK